MVPFHEQAVRRKALRHTLTALFLTALASASHAEIIPESSFRSGNWEGAAYTSNADGRFSHCAISAPYRSGDTLFFSVNADATVTVAVESPGLDLAEGQSIPVALYVDRRPPIYATANALSDDFAALTIPDFKLAMDQFRRGYMLRVQSSVGSGEYSLEGTFRALEAARECALLHLDYVAAPPPAQPVDRTILFQIATEMIAEAGITNFQYLDAAETREAFGDNAVLFKDDRGLLGGAIIIPRGGIVSLAESDASDMAFFSADCSGDILSGIRRIEVPDTEAREIRTACVSDGQTTETRATKILVGEYVLYTLLSFTGDYDGADQAPRADLSESVAVRAASFLMRN